SRSAGADGPTARRWGGLLRYLAAVLVVEPVDGLVEALRQFLAGLARHRDQAREGRLRFAHLVRHAAPLRFGSGAAADRVGRERLTEPRGEILARLGPGLVL